MTAIREALGGHGSQTMPPTPHIQVGCVSVPRTEISAAATEWDEPLRVELPSIRQSPSQGDCSVLSFDPIRTHVERRPALRSMHMLRRS